MISDNFHRCLDCKTDYHGHVTCIYTRLKDKAYTVKLYKNGKLAISSTSQDPIFELEHQSMITPRNVKEKLKTYLLFL